MAARSIAPGPAGAFAVGGGAMVVELQRDADHVIAGIGQQRRCHRGIHAAGHRNDDARVGGPSLDVESIQHDNPWFAGFGFSLIIISVALPIRHY